MTFFIQRHRGAQLAFGADAQVSRNPSLLGRDAPGLLRKSQEFVAKKWVATACQAIPVIGRDVCDAGVDGNLH